MKNNYAQTYATNRLSLCKIIYKVISNSNTIKPYKMISETLALHYNGLSHCPICNKKYNDKFMKTGKNYPVITEKQIIGGGERYTRCPICQSNERQRLTYLFLSNIFRTNNSKRLKVIHIAPEKCLSSYLSKLDNIEYIKGDLFCSGYKYPADVINLDLMNLALETNSVDVFICNHVLEHVQDDIRCMREIYRVLKPGGIAVLQVPYSLNTEHTIRDKVSSNNERIAKYGQRDHVRLFGMDYPNLLESVGFKVYPYKPDKNTTVYLHLNPNETLWTVQK